MMKLISMLTGRAGGRQGANFPLLNGFSEGRTLQLPPGEPIAQEGVLLREADSGRRAVPTCEEAWIALKLDRRTGWYALWCPYALRWEVLSFEVEQAAVPYARRLAGQVRRSQRAG